MWFAKQKVIIVLNLGPTILAKNWSHQRHECITFDRLHKYYKWYSNNEWNTWMDKGQVIFIVDWPRTLKSNFNTSANNAFSLKTCFSGAGSKMIPETITKVTSLFLEVGHPAVMGIWILGLLTMTSPYCLFFSSNEQLWQNKWGIL